MNTDQLMDKLVKAISYRYAEDKTSPGVTISALKKGYYCSVVRYDGAFAKGKQVVCTGRGVTLEAALQDVANTFMATMSPLPKNPVQELFEFVVKGYQ